MHFTMGLAVHLTGPIASDNRTHAGSMSWQQCSTSSATARGGIARGDRGPMWVLETSAPFLDVDYDATSLIGTPAGVSFVRGYFDAEGGMPRVARARLYLQLSQKNRAGLETLIEILEHEGIACGRLHQPSIAVDPDYWRFYVRSSSHEYFMRKVSSWHPRKRQQIAHRLCTRMVR